MRLATLKSFTKATSEKKQRVQYSKPLHRDDSNVSLTSQLSDDDTSGCNINGVLKFSNSNEERIIPGDINNMKDTIFFHCIETELRNHPNKHMPSDNGEREGKVETLLSQSTLGESLRWRAQSKDHAPRSIKRGLQRNTSCRSDCFYDNVETAATCQQNISGFKRDINVEMKGPVMSISCLDEPCSSEKDVRSSINDLSPFDDRWISGTPETSPRAPVRKTY